MLPTVRERSTHSSTTKTVLASQYPESALVSVQPVSESTNYCPVSTSSVSTSRFRSRPPSPFRSRPPSPFRSGPLPFTGYESGQPVSKLASRLRNQPAGFEMGWVANRALTYIQRARFHKCCVMHCTHICIQLVKPGLLDKIFFERELQKLHTVKFKLEVVNWAEAGTCRVHRKLVETWCHQKTKPLSTLSLRE